MGRRSTTGVRVVPFKHGDLSVSLSAETGEGGIYVAAEGSDIRSALSTWLTVVRSSTWTTGL